MSILSAGIFVLCISLTIAVQLDGSCMNETQCDGPHMICSAGKCQCKTPWYEPCNSTCALHGQFVYEGKECLVTENCVPNTKCSNGTCECNSGYIGKNGLCLKSLNATCQNHDECWSNYCLGLRCICPPNSEARDDNTCQRKFVDVYNNWNDANATGAFCVDDDSCLDILAACSNDSAHPTKNFCKCPIGYKITEKRCEAIKGVLLSPLDGVPPNYGECGVCDDKNAACILASNQTTCWCRAGYGRNGNECVKDRSKSMMIFPNVDDLRMHDFTSTCLNEINRTKEISNQTCVCIPGYEFVEKNGPCKKIQSNWQGHVYEYGVCTRISSRDDAKGEHGVCQEPLKCEARNDKHVCSCGVDKFRDIDDPSQCVYFLGKMKGTAPNDRCPTKNAKVNSGSNVCECDVGYEAVNENRRCELKLSAETSQISCSSDRSNDSVCMAIFGIKSFLCTIGECRCSGNGSFANKEKTFCYAPLNRALADPKENCPLYSRLVADHCECVLNYQASADLRECVRLTPQLTLYKGVSINTSVGLDCQAFFTGPVQVYDKNLCQCGNNAFINDGNDGCWYQLNVSLPAPQDVEFCPPHSTIDGSLRCQCNTGFTSNGRKCVEITKRVFNDNDPTAVNVSGITRSDCVKLFGQGAMKSSKGDYCICNSNAYPVNGYTYCYFLLDISSDEFKNPDNCPANTDVVARGTNFECVCKAGYVRSPDNQTCDTTTIELVGTEQIGTENCIIFSNNDCLVKYGDQAFCKDEKCYCNRRLSFMNTTRQCESFDNYVYPGEHELNAYACTSEQDCGGQARVICDYFNQESGYKVCKCQDGTHLNPKSQTCETRCINCREDLHFECRGYECQCKNGYYLNGARCVEFSPQLQLYQQCNATIFRENLPNNSVICNSTCNRAQCNDGYGAKGSQCARYELGKDSCVYRDSICESIDRNSICVREENHCSCRTGYYERAETCARAVGSDCRDDEECGTHMICQAKRCACGTGQAEQRGNDIVGRPILVCVDINNGIDRIRFQPVLFVFFLLARLFLI